MNKENSLKILLLCTEKTGRGVDSLTKAAKKRGHEVKVVSPSELYLLISDNIKGYDKIYENVGKEETPKRLYLKDIDSVIPRIGGNAYGKAVLEHLAGNLNIFCTTTARGINLAGDKFATLQKLSQDNIKVPKTILADDPQHLSWMIDQIGGLPAICKTISGSQGVGVVPLQEPQQTNAMVESFYKNGWKLLFQNFIDSGSKDIRAIVIDGEVITAMERTGKKGELRANISLGGEGKKIELTDYQKNICIRASRAVGLPLASGVDLMVDEKSGETYVIEVNSNYGYKIEEITGDDISTPLIEVCEKYHKKGNIQTPSLYDTGQEAGASFLLGMLAGHKLTYEGKNYSKLSFEERISLSALFRGIDEDNIKEEISYLIDKYYLEV